MNDLLGEIECHSSNWRAKSERRVPTAPEVYNLSPSMLLVGLSIAQSPWLPQLEAIFEDVQKILPNQAYDVMGCVSDYPYQVKLIDSITVRVFMSRFGNYLRMIFPRLLRGLTKKVLLSERSVDKRMAFILAVFFLLWMPISVLSLSRFCILRARQDSIPLHAMIR